MKFAESVTGGKKLMLNGHTYTKKATKKNHIVIDDLEKQTSHILGQ